MHTISLLCKISSSNTPVSANLVCDHGEDHVSKTLRYLSSTGHCLSEILACVQLLYTLLSVIMNFLPSRLPCYHLSHSPSVHRRPILPTNPPASPHSRCPHGRLPRKFFAHKLFCSLFILVPLCSAVLFQTVSTNQVVKSLGKRYQVC